MSNLIAIGAVIWMSKLSFSYFMRVIKLHKMNKMTPIFSWVYYNFNNGYCLSWIISPGLYHLGELKEPKSTLFIQVVNKVELNPKYLRYVILKLKSFFTDLGWLGYWMVQLVVVVAYFQKTDFAEHSEKKVNLLNI